MGPEWVAILALIALFVAGTALPINMGALAYVAAWLVGMYSLGLDEKEILAGVSGDLILTLIGVTYLFAVARNNGTVDVIVNSAVRAVGGRVALIPWVMFAVTAVLTAIGAASPAACAIIGPIALGFAGRYGINPLMMGMFVVHGAQGGGFSPISIYGTITNSVMEEANLPTGEMTVFLASLAINLVMAAILFALFGRGLLRRRVAPDHTEETPEAVGATAPSLSGDARAAGSGGDRPVSGGTAGGGAGTGRAADDPPDDGADGGGAERDGVTRPRTAETGGTGAAAEAAGGERTGGRRDHVLTLVAFALVAIVALVFDKNIGFVAITAAVVLAMLSPTQHRDAVKQVAWPTVLLVAGVSTYAAILNEAGSPEFVGKWAAGLGAVAIGALVLCYVGGVVSAFASSTALLPVIIPIGVPLVVDGGINAALFVAALAISSTIVDVSPFSTNGALILANRPEAVPEARFYRQILTYSVIVVLVGPLLVWAALVLPA
ncbi:SLC13 family permease [Cryptosporangium arvum]|uniref:SLC13 family permease n=1 Tax=Cryptosporangium arvum TaxID=80871 RepID=UPI0004B9C147|nr:SLC13 family permease [Cryptosporangium arvum]